MAHSHEKEFRNWSIEKGDYKRDAESSLTHIKKVYRKRLLIQILWLVLAVTVIGSVTWYFLAH